MKINLDHTQIIITRNKKKIFKTVYIILTAITVISIFLSGLALANKNKVVYGLKIADVSIGGLNAEETKIKIEKAVEKFSNRNVVLKYNSKKKEKIWTTLPQELGITIKLQSSLAAATKIGHQKNLFSNLGQQVLALFGYYNLPLNCEINETQLENFINNKLNSIDNPAVNASWQYNEKINKFVQIPSQQGMVIDRQNLKFQLYKKTKKLAKDDIFLTLIADYPEILENETIQAYNTAKKILKNAPYKLIANNSVNETPVEVFLTKEKLISIIEFKPVPDKNNSENLVLGIGLKQEELKNYLTTLSSSINRNPINSQFTIEGDRVTEFRLSQDGLKLEIEKNIQKIKEGILSQNKKNLVLETSIIAPKVATKDINTLGIASLLGKGVSNFGGSPNNRIHNIKLGAAKFHGLLIKPGEEFSFNTILGKVGPEQGYKPELVIKRTKTTREYGGGLCHVSTTIFRAAVNAGLPITERQPHAFPVVYYNPQGFDATVYFPHPDLRFVNNTPAYLLIQTKIEGNDLIFEFYGTDDGRKVEIDGPYQYDLKSDGSMKAKLTRRIYKNGELIEEKTWYSNYRSPSLYPVR